MKYVIYVNAGYREGIGGHICWFNETSRKTFYEKRGCKDSFRCEYEAVLKAITDHEDIIKDNEIEMLMDNITVVKQLNKKYGINSDDSRDMALKIWKLVREKCQISMDSEEGQQSRENIRKLTRRTAIVFLVL